MDSKALKILFNSYWSSKGWEGKEQASIDDFEYAKSKGIMFDPVSLDHNEIIKWFLRVFDETSKKHIVKCFLSSLSIRRLDWRSGLSSYALGRHCPKHNFSINSNVFCRTCGMIERKEQHNINILNFERFKWGGVRLSDPLYAAFNLEILNKEITPNPTKEDIAIFNEIIETIKYSDQTDKPGHLEKKLASIIKSNNYERRVIIEIMGICGILETENHKGFFDSFVSYTNRPVRPVNKTDWSYPVDWWTGKDGLNESALEFYFSEYLRK